MNKYNDIKEYIHTAVLPAIFSSHHLIVQDTLQPRLDDAEYNHEFHVIPEAIQADKGVDYGWRRPADSIVHNLHFRRIMGEHNAPTYERWQAKRHQPRRDSYTIGQLKEIQ